MFRFVSQYLNFLKPVPGAALVFDAWLRIATLFTHPEVSRYIDHIESEVCGWHNIRVSIHKYGGLQFNYASRQLGHIHGNGLLDMLFTREIKQQLMTVDERIKHHHVFKNNGWISFYIETEADAAYVIELFKMAYEGCRNKENAKPYAASPLVSNPSFFPPFHLQTW
ncbi:luciferase family protein [Mucilaginibacter sp.]|uniref:luciferase domain-containing protein n=1 Tax=Mucilaginibacter sp. TaxID=1882438 RepID=UPI0032673F82